MDIITNKYFINIMTFTNLSLSNHEEMALCMLYQCSNILLIDHIIADIVNRNLISQIYGKVKVTSNMIYGDDVFMVNYNGKIKGSEWNYGISEGTYTPDKSIIHYESDIIPALLVNIIVCSILDQYKVDMVRFKCNLSHILDVIKEVCDKVTSNNTQEYNSCLKAYLKSRWNRMINSKYINLFDKN